MDDPFELAERIRTVIAAETGLSCSVGISDNKQRAKVATGFGKPDGVYQLTDDNWMAVMGDRPLAVTEKIDLHDGRGFTDDILDGLVDRSRSLNEGAKVSYEEVANRGKTSAENLRVG